MSDGERVASLDDLEPGEALQVIVDGQMIAVVRDEAGGVHALADMCSHATVPLSEGEVDDCTIECWLHGSRFDLKTGEPTGLPAITPVDVYPVTVDGTDIFVDTTTVIGANATASAGKEN